MTRRWRYLLAAVVVLAVAVLVARCGGPELLPVGPRGDLVIAGRVTLEPATPAVGRVIRARITVSADRSVTLRRLAVRMRAETGGYADFPPLTDVALGPAEREFTVELVLDKPGEYSYFLAYQLDGDWVSLPPWQQVTVR
ncbi:hypothetical protein Lfu02_02650 [Longispora fulva]|uniref:Uncharacterized protein n=1 Tax=Longispora fulva TaxID=619741 RepID=A0A8J7GGS0_9ACTN|nr:hypothetical protein [Longispora fulva]MBG6135863.1 hypothetical protein [Longispora fulva]GIG55893.1 hypothetical protein Lfu02_02650 [Longispora fulva]